MGQNKPHDKPRLHTVTAKVDKVLFPDGSELESSSTLADHAHVQQMIVANALGTDQNGVMSFFAQNSTVNDLTTRLSSLTTKLSKLEADVDSTVSSLQGDIATYTKKTDFDAQVALLAPKTELTAQVALLTLKTEHALLLASVHGIVQENSRQEIAIGELQSAVEKLSLSVLDHRAAFDNLADRQASEPGAWEGSDSGIYAGYLRDNAIPVPVFNWPWIPRRYITTTTNPIRLAIQTFTPDEQNYVQGDYVYLSGWTTTVAVDPAQINGIQMVEASVTAANSTLGFPYLELGLDATIGYIVSGYAHGVSWVKHHVSTTAEPITHLFSTAIVDGNVIMEVASYGTGDEGVSVSYEYVYTIGDSILIGGVTEPVAGLLASDINGVHTITGFGDSADEFDNFRYSFFVNADGATPGSQFADAWTQPISVALNQVSEITDSSGIADEDLTPDGSLN